MSATADEIRLYIDEDIGAGDLTAVVVPAALTAKATVISRESMVVCGKSWFSGVFALLDPAFMVSWEVSDGDQVVAGNRLCTLQGNARLMLSGERTALNLLQTLSATATVARRFADAVKGTGTRVLDTRKTLPGLRKAQKYAVRCGGCHNHRIGLFDGVLIKENHILASGSIAKAVSLARSKNPGVPIEVEVESLEELSQALATRVERVLLDNFSVAMLAEAVSITGGRAETEASGNITLENVRTIAETGVDYISVGSLTKDVKAIDLSMRIQLL